MVDWEGSGSHSTTGIRNVPIAAVGSAGSGLTPTQGARIGQPPASGAVASSIVRVLTVCSGNICRSPTAEAALREALEEAGLDDRVEVDSAGTGSWHLGDPPDRRMVAAAAEAGLHVDGRARRITEDDLEDFDLVLTMDRSNHRDVRRLAGDDSRAEIRMFREFDPEADRPDAEVPDPYYGGKGVFDDVVTLTRRTAAKVVEHLRAELA